MNQIRMIHGSIGKYPSNMEEHKHMYGTNFNIKFYPWLVPTLSQTKITYFITQQNIPFK